MLAVVIGAIIGSLATVTIGSLLVAGSDVRRHNHLVSVYDSDLEEWLVTHDRQLEQDFRQLAQDANARGVACGGTIPAGRQAKRTLLHYAYREKLRQTHAAVDGLQADEMWTHRIVRRFTGEFPELNTTTRGQELIEYWSVGTKNNALSWSLADILAELPSRDSSQ